MSEELLTGVEMQDDSAAGDQQEEEDIFGLSEDTGEEESQEDAASEEAETGAFEDESKEKAFAARLRKEREKIAQETEERCGRNTKQSISTAAAKQQHNIPPQLPAPAKAAA